ncbi:hypothetical protein SAMN04515667_2577 [Formosa sp. Hel1_31_208]|nr:hypothetical protein SAMN04515667_2577 [Formosa sp. Hel1_31_208]
MYLHIILLFFGISYHAHALDTDTAVILQTLQDSVYIDKEPIERRQYNDLKDKYSGNEFIYERTVENSGWWSRFKQWLSDFFKNLFDINSDARASDFTDTALKIFYIVIFLLVVYFIVKAIINKEGNWVFGKSSDKNIIPVVDVEHNIHEADFKTLISKAESEDNYRLAIRYYYLWLLKTLSQAEVIEYDVEKTNSDYYLEIDNETIKKEFSYTSYLYNYIWYGEFDIDSQQFDKAKNAYTQFLKTLWK